ncbi:methyl-accepting chemotaxis protein [Pseudophaeobacter leonis]|uniref:methyl-accepting chemotaxis protein n=1 Tax=Pseudophaeobacter leonis TaxID=1144477 RepID=UPI0009F50928|nr:methyl-accepting chemotaxis protein [Pseudophaeobacter leonis]
MQSLTDIQSAAFLAIGPSRIAALSLIVLRSREDSDEARTARQLSADRITAAHEMLRSKLPEMLEASDHSFPKTLEDQRLACLKAITPLVASLEDPSKAQETSFADHSLYQLEPLVSRFLEDMTADLLDNQNKLEIQRQEDILKAIANAEGVGKNIQLIAFNASIEAARIGDLGKGFTVIANEIRELSGKTQLMLNNISDLLRT